MKKRVISLFLALVLLFGTFPVTALANTPAGEEDTFAENATVKGNNGVAELLADKINTQQAAQNGSPSYPYGYGVYGLTFENGVATVQYHALEDALVIVALYTEDGLQMLTSATAQVSSAARSVEVTFEDALPAYFRASAYLLDPENYAPLCNAHSTPMYTRAMQELMASTADDYDPEKVWNPDGDKTNNFFVFEDNTILIHETGNSTVTADAEQLLYKIENGDPALAALKAGDKFAYFYGENGVIVATVASISVAGTTVTVQGGDITLQDMFSHIKMDTSTDYDDFSIDPNQQDTDVTYVGKTAPARSVRSEAYPDHGDEEKPMEVEKYWFVFGKPDDEEDEDQEVEDTAEVEVEGKIGVGAICGFSYHMAEETEYTKFQVDAEIELDITVTGKLGTTYRLFKLSANFFEGLLTVAFAPTYTIEFSAAFQTNNVLHFTFGFTVDDKNGCNPLDVPPLTVKNEIVLEGSFKMFFTWNPTLKFAQGFLASLSLPVETGVAINGKENGTFVNGMPSEDRGLPSIHLCELCTRVTMGFVFNMKVEIEFLNCKFLKMEFDIFTEEDFENELVVLECYYSKDNEQFGWGVCPNQKYLATIQAQYRNEIPIADLGVWYRYIEENKIITMPEKTNRNGIITEYFVSGNYTFFATIDEKQSEAKVKLTEPCKVILRASETGEIQATVLGSKESDLVMDAGIVAEYGVCGKDGNNLTWALYDTGVLKIYGTGEMGSAPWRNSKIPVTMVVIAEGATNVMERAFYLCSKMTKAVLPESLTRIEANAFASCTQMTEVNIPANVTAIEADAFYNCGKLTNLTLSDGLTTIGDRAFEYCKGLQTLRIPESVTHIGRAAFSGCSALTEVKLPAGLTVISGRLFGGCEALTNIEIPQGVKEIGDNAFYGCKGLTQVRLPSGITEIANSTFHSCTGLVDITLPAGLTKIGENAFTDCENLPNLTIPAKVTEISDYAFAGCKSLQSLVIPKGVTVLNKYILNGCESLQTLILPDGLTTISGWALYNCSGPSQIKIPASVTSIGDGAFGKCTNLQHIEIPDGITAVADNTFKECSSLQTVKLPESVTALGYAAFYRCKQLVSINIPAGVTELPGFVFEGCAALETLALPAGITTIGEAAFQHCSGLQNIRIPAAVTFIDEYAFYGCASIKTLEIPAGVTSIEGYTFSNNSSLVHILLPEGITTIGGSAFWGCESLEEIRLPETVTSIGSDAFKFCSALRSIVIPEGVTVLGYEVFYCCTNLSEVTLPSTLREIGYQTFYDCDSLVHVDIPEGVTDLGRSFAFCSSLQSVSLPSTLVNISGTFSYCSNLVEASIPDSVTHIGGGTFYYCENLAYVDLGNSVQTIGTSAFHGCKNLGGVAFPATLTHIYSSAFQECETLSLLRFLGDAPAIDTWAFLCTFRAEYITAYYPAGNSTWTSDKMPTYNDRITWVASSSGTRTRQAAAASAAKITIAPAPDTQLQKSRGLQLQQDVHNVRAIVGGAYNTEEKDGYTLKTASFKDLVPGEAYVMLAVKDLKRETFLDPENLLYIDQAVAQADGTLQFQYVQREATGVSYVMVCGKSNKDLQDARISFPPMQKDAQLRAVNPSVVYNGVKLTEGVDYEITGQVCYDKVGTYTCTVRGINQYTGAVECTYTVTDYIPGDMNRDDVVDNQDVIYLLWYTVFPEDYPISINADFTGDGAVDNQDVIYLLWYTVFPEDYPLT